MKIIVKKETNKIPNKTTYEVYIKKGEITSWYGRTYDETRLVGLLKSTEDLSKY